MPPLCCVGWATGFVEAKYGLSVIDTYRFVFVEYGGLACLLLLLTLLLSSRLEAARWLEARK